MKNNYKAKLKRRGQELYSKYFFNSDNIIKYVINNYDNNILIDEKLCDVILDIPIEYNKQIYELITYYPNKLKEIKIITVDVINDLYIKYGETIEIMRENKHTNNVRGRLSSSAQRRSKEYGYFCDLISEDIVLVKSCPYLNIPIEYGLTKVCNSSASLDRIKPELGYIKSNVQVISLLANQMKSNANIEQLKTFANNILKLYL